MEQINEQTEAKADLVRKDNCSECGKPWNSEYHISDECVNNLNEDREDEL